MLNQIIILSGFLILFLFLLNAWVYFQQPAMIFFPEKNLVETPFDWGLDFQEVNLTTEDKLQIHGWYIPQENAQETLLFFHGNAGNISHRGESVAIFNQLGLNVLIIDYRGYGQSEGTPSEKGFYNDAFAAWNFLSQTKNIKKENIIIFGRSMGGVVATELASKVQPGKLIVESSFSSAKDVARELFPLLYRLIILRFNFNAEKYLKFFNGPLLVLHSAEDEIIPFHLGKKLFEAGNEPKQFVQIKGDHNSGFVFSQPYYQKALADFIHQEASD